MNKLLLWLWMAFVPLFAGAKDFPTQSNPPKLVNDFAGVLSEGEKANLESRLVAYSDSTSTQIAIVIERSLEGEDAFDYSQRLAENWGIGVKGKNNGLLIYVAIDDHKIRIQTGYGMEGTITDALSKRIIEENIKPNFKAKNYYQGFSEAIDIIMRAASGEYVNDQKGKKGGGPNLAVIVIIIILILIFVFTGRGGGRRRRYNSWGGGPFFGTFGSGGFSGGGDFGGGFGGFGGGSFGGGGAGGDW